VNKIYMFDVDGTLTPARSLMHEEFQGFFSQWAEGRTIYLVSGSDLVKIREQLPPHIMEKCAGVYSSMANCYHVGEQIVYRNIYSPTDELLSDLELLVENSTYTVATGNHIELRDGMVNFTVLGRNATHGEREAYYKWDLRTKNREHMADWLSETYDDLEFAIGGKISLDIYPRGYDKAQAVSHVRASAGKEREIVFFGDRTEFPGNDYGIVKALDDSEEPSCWHNVSGWTETMGILRARYDDRN